MNDPSPLSKGCLDIWIDEIVPCLRDTETGEMKDTVVFRMRDTVKYVVVLAVLFLLFGSTLAFCEDGEDLFVDGFLNHDGIDFGDSYFEIIKKESFERVYDSSAQLCYKGEVFGIDDAVIDYGFDNNNALSYSLCHICSEGTEAKAKRRYNKVKKAITDIYGCI